MRRQFCTVESQDKLVTHSDQNGVRTLTMNNARRFNAWTPAMLEALFNEFNVAATDEDIHVVILTGRGKYYCAGVDLAGVLKPMHPQTLHDLIYRNTKLLFDQFLDFPKPLIAAMNGPAIGAPVTTAALCDALIMNEHATLSTPFARLGVTPEGCSSVHFPRVMGETAASRMLGPDSWTPTAAEAVEVGLAHRVVMETDDMKINAAASNVDERSSKMSELLLAEAQRVAESWIAEGRLHRSLPGQQRAECGNKGIVDTMGAAKMGAEATAARALLNEYKIVNDAECQEVARRFLGPDFLRAQVEFMSSKGKTRSAAIFKALLVLRPFWAMLLSENADVIRYRKSM